MKTKDLFEAKEFSAIKIKSEFKALGDAIADDDGYDELPWWDEFSKYFKIPVAKLMCLNTEDNYKGTELIQDDIDANDNFKIIKEFDTGYEFLAVGEWHGIKMGAVSDHGFYAFVTTKTELSKLK